MSHGDEPKPPPEPKGRRAAEGKPGDNWRGAPGWWTVTGRDGSRWGLDNSSGRVVRLSKAR